MSKFLIAKSEEEEYWALCGSVEELDTAPARFDQLVGFLGDRAQVAVEVLAEEPHVGVASPDLGDDPPRPHGPAAATRALTRQCRSGQRHGGACGG